MNGSEDVFFLEHNDKVKQFIAMMFFETDMTIALAAHLLKNLIRTLRYILKSTKYYIFTLNFIVEWNVKKTVKTMNYNFLTNFFNEKICAISVNLTNKVQKTKHT